MLRLTALPALADNYIWMLADADRGTALVVDPGEASPVLRALDDRALQLRAILLTHHHPDHTDGASGLLARYPEAVIFAPFDDRIGIAHHRADDGDEIAIDSPGVSFDVLAVPGHTRSHVAYHGGGMLFCGDTLFSLGCGRLFEGSPAQMLSSLDRLSSLPDATQVCCGHEYTLANAGFARQVEPHNAALRVRESQARRLRDAGEPTLPSRLDDERATNPFLRIDALPAQAWPDFVPRPGDASMADRVARFAALRAAKDMYKAPSA